MKTKLLSLTLVFALLATLVPTTVPAYAATNAVRATPAYAVALSCPYHFTLSVQDNKLVLSGNAPDYIFNSADNPKMVLDIIKPVNYASCTVGSDGLASVTTDITKVITSALNEIGPLSTVSGYASLDRTTAKVTNFVNDLLKRNPDLDREYTTTLLYNLLNIKDSGVDLGSSTSIVQGILNNIPVDNLASNIVETLLLAAPKTVNVVKTVTHTLNPDSSAMAPVIPAKDINGKDVWTYDWPNIPTIDLAGVADGVYNLRVNFRTDRPNFYLYCNYLYCDDILLVVKGGKASLQLLPTYRREGWYNGYSLNKWDVRPAITQADEYKWQKGL